MEWEYRCERTPDWKALGAAGWECVTHRDGEYVFKRPAPSAIDRFTYEQSERALAHIEPLCQPPKLLNPQLAALARRIGHTQMLIVCDLGFPVPTDLPLGVVDLSVTAGLPTVPQVLDALLPELPHDRIIVAGQMQQRSPDRWHWHKQQRTPLEIHPHAELKHLAKLALACVRTGDSTPYGNVIIVGG